MRPSAPSTTPSRAESSGIVDDAIFDDLRREVDAELHGAGPLESLLCAADVTDVLVNGPDSVWLDRGRGMERSTVRFAERGRGAAPCATAGGDRPAGGSTTRCPTSTSSWPTAPGCTPCCRRCRGTRRSRCGSSLVGRTTSIGWSGWARCPGRSRTCCVAMVTARLAFVVAGGTGAGKTTLLGALLGEVDGRERLLVIEDAPELVVAHPHLVRLVCRAAERRGCRRGRACGSSSGRPCGCDRIAWSSASSAARRWSSCSSR